MSFGVFGSRFRVSPVMLRSEWTSLEKSAAPRERRRAGAALTLCRTGGSVEDVVGCSLRLCGSMNEKLAISAEFLEPACEIGGLIANDPV